jgi:hypothetical protein
MITDNQLDSLATGLGLTMMALIIVKVIRRKLMAGVPLPKRQRWYGSENSSSPSSGATKDHIIMSMLAGNCYN